MREARARRRPKTEPATGRVAQILVALGERHWRKLWQNSFWVWAKMRGDRASFFGLATLGRGRVAVRTLLPGGRGVGPRGRPCGSRGAFAPCLASPVKSLADAARSRAHRAGRAAGVHVRWAQGTVG
jgi:hypothetical protein